MNILFIVDRLLFTQIPDVGLIKLSFSEGVESVFFVDTHFRLQSGCCAGRAKARERH